MFTRVWLVTFALIFLAGCPPREVRVCDKECDCEGCTDAEFDRCVEERDEDFFEADDKNCGPEYRDLLACENATWTCDGGDFKTDCDPEEDRLDECVD